ncbi:hypothetical protein [uncultured Roseivirga sp.]|uniref:hypothetical protein n=1 Tax=uncultured Roseivirga sp. TaxID=543088 RepID=UPI0030DC2DE0|tara:strand:- start:705 stop:1379 length:675 start_codon:yes stop_codon:yes gene_type:complete
MEKFIQNAGRALAKVRTATNDFLNERIGGNRRNLILFLVCVYILFILLVSVVLNFKSLIDHYPIYLGLLFALILAIFWVAVFYESESHMAKDGHGFVMERLKRSRMKFHLLDLDLDGQRELERILSGKNVKSKINFTMGNKSGESANHRILFVLFDEIMVGGVVEISGEQKQEFFQFLQNSFLMNGEPINPNTLKSGFSSWKTDQEKTNSKNQRKLVKQMLGKA